MRRAKAFTLIELLVVIAIIAILAAILFPVYARMKEKAIRTLCLSNCKQLGTAFQTYVDDNDGKYPGGGGVDASNPPKAAWVISPAHWDIHVDTGALFPYVKNRDLYVCPVQRKKTIAIKLSYTMNAKLSLLSQSNVVSPSGCLLLIEEDDSTVNNQEGPNDGLFVDGNSWDRPAQRHNGGGNHMFGDGHAKWVPYTRLRTVNDTNDPLYYNPTQRAPTL